MRVGDCRRRRLRLAEQRQVGDEIGMFRKQRGRRSRLSGADPVMSPTECTTESQCAM